MRRCRALWLKQVDAHPKDFTVLANAAEEFLLQDKAEAERLFGAVATLSPITARGRGSLGQLHMLTLSNSAGEVRQGIAAKALAEYENAHALATNDIECATLLIDLAKSAFEAGDSKKAKAYALALAEDAAKGRADWNRGNAIHHSHVILGRLASLMVTWREPRRNCMPRAKLPARRN